MNHGVITAHGCGSAGVRACVRETKPRKTYPILSFQFMGNPCSGGPERAEVMGVGKGELTPEAVVCPREAVAMVVDELRSDEAVEDDAEDDTRLPDDTTAAEGEEAM